MALRKEDYKKFLDRQEKANELSKKLQNKLGYSVIFDSHNEDLSEAFYIINLPFTPVRNGFKTYYHSSIDCNLRSVNAKIKSIIKNSDEDEQTLGWEISSKPKMVKDKLKVNLGYETNFYRIKVFFI